MAQQQPRCDWGGGQQLCANGEATHARSRRVAALPLVLRGRTRARPPARSPAYAPNPALREPPPSPGAATA